MIIHHDIKNLWKSFRYALSGFLYCLRNERNMRIHIVAGSLVGLFSYYFGVSGTEAVFLTLCIAMVIAGEMFNTSIETVVNMESPSYNKYARIAKDVAAGAVFVTALAAVCVGGIIFIKPDKLGRVFDRIFSDPIAIALFSLILIIGFFFVFHGKMLFKEKPIKIYEKNVPKIKR